MQIEKGEIIEGKITGITKYGAFVSINKEISGMIHISEISFEFIKDINERLKLNQTVKAVVIGVNTDGKLALSIKQLPKNNDSDKSNKSIETNETNETDDISETIEAIGKSKVETPEEFIKTNKNQGSQLNFEDMLNKFKRESDEKMSDLKSLEQRKGGSSTSKRRPNQKFEQ